MLDGLIIKPLKRFPDDRGYFTEILREDWKELLNDQTISQANLSITYPNIVRAWHKHERGQIDYFIVAKGALKICAYDDVTKELDEVVSTGENIQIVKVPGHYWHGFKVVSPNTTILVYLVNNMYDPKNPDEQRRPWNDPTIIPESINGKTSDPRVGKPWDWMLLPNK